MYWNWTTLLHCITLSSLFITQLVNYVWPWRHQYHTRMCCVIWSDALVVFLSGWCHTKFWRIEHVCQNQRVWRLCQHNMQCCQSCLRVFSGVLKDGGSRSCKLRTRKVCHVWFATLYGNLVAWGSVFDTNHVASNGVQCVLCHITRTYCFNRGLKYG